jgi:hypothetical protein
MAKEQKRWVYKPAKESKPKVLDSIKRKVQTEANEFVESILKPKYIKLPPKDSDFSYIVDIFTKWYRNYFYFCSKYRCPAPECTSDFFEDKFARLEYVRRDSFNLSFMRHTGQWWQVHTDLSLDECLESIKDNPTFEP